MDGWISLCGQIFDPSRIALSFYKVQWFGNLSKGPFTV